MPESLGNRRFGEIDGFFDPFIAPIAPRDVVLGHARKRKRQLEFDDGAHGRLFAVTFLADEIAFERDVEPGVESFVFFDVSRSQQSPRLGGASVEERKEAFVVGVGDAFGQASELHVDAESVFRGVGRELAQGAARNLFERLGLKIGECRGDVDRRNRLWWLERTLPVERLGGRKGWGPLLGKRAVARAQLWRWHIVDWRLRCVVEPFDLRRHFFEMKSRCRWLFLWLLGGVFTAASAR